MKVLAADMIESPKRWAMDLVELDPIFDAWNTVLAK